MKGNAVKRPILAAAIVFLASPAFAQDTLQAVIKDHWAWTLENSPVFATSLGVRDYDDRLQDSTLAAYEAAVEDEKRFLARLDALDAAALAPGDRVNYDLLKLDLENDVEASKFGGKYLAISNRSGPHTFITGLPDDLPFFTVADYESYAARLAAAPAYVDGVIERLSKGVETGFVQPCASMEGYGKTIRYHIVDDPADSAMMRPFDAKPAAISAKDWKRLEAAARRAVAEKAIPAIARFADFYDEIYAPACRQEVGASALPDGRAYYDFRARLFTTTQMTADEIHALGLKEVARIRKEMDATIRAAKFEGGFKAFQEFLRTDPQFYAKTPLELMEKNSLVAKKIDGELPKLFGRLPRMPYTLKEIPADTAEGTTTAYYEPPAGDGTRAGVYRVNTSKLATRPLYEIEALTLHEAVPGHHFQIALSQELDLPEFRKYGGFTAFIEGWGLYAESLGLDVGFYKDPYSNFGRLSYEMWRACRLVVDTGVHAKGWSRQQAIDYMKENTALSEHNITAEVDRYIANPGQALAYKIGQLKFKELRERAVRALGPKFDLRRFHDAALANGAIPLSALDGAIDRWIAAEKAR
ncbi:MAG TPA: DUF885 domain-containing protein [Parvularcula sp.]|nr:DUF885 domain-containing protein [Parvularcula sp.]HBS30490.1 DUF885 domain-containing protein [Parvularcula sp.]HBS33645.1 DUF885 domain-containing protein [Parvularcula sp.]